MAKKFTARQALFVAEYLVDLNATQAAIRAGYSERTAEKIGYENLHKPEIAAALADGKARQLAKADLSASRVLEEMRRLAFIDLGVFFDDVGNLKRINELTAEQRSALSSVKVVIKNVAAGDGHVDYVHEIKLWDKPRTLEMLAKHFKLLTEQIEMTDKTDPATLAARVQAGRLRAAQRNKRQG